MTLPSTDVPPGNVTPLCSVCGLQLVGPTCPHCNAPGSTAPAPGLPDGIRCAVVRASAACRVCGLAMPLNHFPLDGTVRCLHCGRAQAADAGLFRELARHAHAVVDLAGDPMSPFGEMGKTQATATEDITGTETFEGAQAIAGPAHPRCERCSGLVAIGIPEPGVVTTTCAACGDAARYQVAQSIRVKGLAGVIASEHRVDRLEVKKAVSGAAVAITCPTCGAPLDPKLDRHIAHCTFCNTACRIPEDTWALLKGPVRTEPWYLFFKGPSALRRKLEQDRARAERRREAEENRARKQQQRREAKQQQALAAAAQPPAPKGMNPRTFGTIAGFSVPAGAMFSGGLVFVVLKDRYMEDPGIPMFAVWAAFAGIGIALMGNKGKIADMPPARARRVLLFSTIGVLATCIAAFVLFVLAERR